MNEDCEICAFVNQANPKTRIFSTDYWHVELGNNQAYFGRAYIQLRKHKASLNELTHEEWDDLQKIMKLLESAYKDLFDAEPLNWSCLMNLAFRKEPYNPHVHWHLYPRYKHPPIFEGIPYPDELYGSFYDHKLENIVTDETLAKIASFIRLYISKIN